MRGSIFIFSVLVFAAGVSCNNSADNNSRTTKSKSRVDSLMDDIMAEHGAGMAKMNRVSSAKNFAVQAIDSIRKLPGKLKKETAEYKNNLDSLLAQLQSAERNMNQWMDEFNMDSLENNPAQRALYLESEKQKATAIKDDLILSLQKSDSLLGKK
ncbi:MAG: hypothetical protein JST10_01130 [Bacteroidetes bacterium]|nr:hypothetical protein [Bacteroidota bacterium]MBS1631154.1 hypothetical protein [Bacteroidota bacterium]